MMDPLTLRPNHLQAADSLNVLIRLWSLSSGSGSHGDVWLLRSCWQIWATSGVDNIWFGVFGVLLRWSAELGGCLSSCLLSLGNYSVLLCLSSQLETRSIVILWRCFPAISPSSGFFLLTAAINVGIGERRRGNETFCHIRRFVSHHFWSAVTWLCSLAYSCFIEVVLYVWMSKLCINALTVQSLNAYESFLICVFFTYIHCWFIVSWCWCFHCFVEILAQPMETYQTVLLTQTHIFGLKENDDGQLKCDFLPNYTIHDTD